MSIAIASALSLFSAIVVAVLSHIFSVRRNRHDNLAALRVSAYADFINVVSRLAAARRTGQTSNEIRELVALNDAKARICISAEAPVVEALAKFWKYGGTLEQEPEILAFTQFCMKVRESLGNRKNEIANIELSQTLFKLEPSEYSFRKEKGTPIENA